MSAIAQRVYDIVGEQLGIRVDELNSDSDFVEELDADSLDIIEMVMAMEEEFDLEISDEEFEKLKTVGDVVDYIEKRKTP